jgi:intraflagellar transport protein 46
LYKPQIKTLKPKLKPFIQDYVPAVGEVDAFLKVPRPDGSKENLGLMQLDEPCLNQSKRSYLDLLIRQFYKGKRKDHEQNIHSINNAHKKQKEVAGWINDVENVQKKKQAPSVFYSNKMPEIDRLMQVYDKNIIDDVGRESNGEVITYEKSEIPLETLTKAVCGVVGIPVHEEEQSKTPLRGSNL